MARESTLLTRRYLTSRIVSTQLTSSGCTPLRFDHVLVLTLMIGLNARLFIRERMRVDVILESTITAVSRVLTSEKERVEEVTCVNTLMGFLSVGYTLLNTGLVFVKTGPAAIDVCVSLLTHKKSFAHYLCLQGQLFLHLGQLRLVQLRWTLQQP